MRHSFATAIGIWCVLSLTVAWGDEVEPPSDSPAGALADSSFEADAMLDTLRERARSDFPAALAWLADHEAAVEALDQLGRFRMRRFEAELRYELGQHDAIRSLFLRFTLGERPTKDRISPLVGAWAEGLTAYYASDYEAAIPWLRAAVAALPDGSSPVVAADLQFDLACALDYAAQTGEAFESFRRAEALYAAAGREEDRLITSLTRMSSDSESPSKLAEFLETADVALRFFADRGDRANQAWILYDVGMSHRGTYASSLESLNLARQFARESGCLMSYLTYTTSAAEVQLLDGRVEQAAATVAEARDLSDEIGDLEARAELARISGAIATRQGHLTEARTQLDKAYALYEQSSGESEFLNWVRMDRANLFETTGDLQAALDELAPAEKWFSQEPSGGFYYEVLDQQVRLLRQMGRFEEAIAKLDYLFELSYEEWESGITERLAQNTLQHEKSLREAQLRSAESERQIALAEAARQRAELAQLDAENERNRVLRNLSFATLGIGVLIGILLLLMIRRERGARALLAEVNQELERNHRELADEVARRQQTNHELLEAIAALKDLDEERKLLLGTTAHELRNPASAILTGIDLLEDEWHSRSSGKQKDLFDLLREAAENLLRIIERIVHLRENRESTRQAPNDYFDPCNLLVHTAYLNQINAERKGQTIELTQEPDVQIWGHSNALREVVDNLLSNAVKYAPRGDRIELQLRSLSAEEVEIRVEDGGPGIAPNEREKLFRPFARLSSVPTGGEPSSGLGLFAAKRACESMEGEIHLVEGSRGGACFIIRLKGLRPSAKRPTTISRSS